eukprot:scpid79470/ scgid27600/ 
MALSATSSSAYKSTMSGRTLLCSVVVMLALLLLVPVKSSPITRSPPIISGDGCDSGLDLLAKLKRHGRARVVIPRNQEEMRANSDLLDIRKTPCTPEDQVKIENDLNSRMHLARKWVTYEDARCSSVFESQCIYASNVYPAYSKRAVLRYNADVHQCADFTYTCQPVKTWTLVLQRVCKDNRMVFVMRPFEYIKTFTCQPDPSLED